MTKLVVSIIILKWLFWLWPYLILLLLWNSFLEKSDADVSTETAKRQNSFTFPALMKWSEYPRRKPAKMNMFSNNVLSIIQDLNYDNGLCSMSCACGSGWSLPAMLEGLGSVLRASVSLTYMDTHEMILNKKRDDILLSHILLTA